MANRHIVALDYIRGIAMLGVLGIHTGAYSLSYPAANPHLFALYEIVTRFSVPIFFFVSAFGLFLSQPLNQSFYYPAFMGKRFRAVLLPYLAWSLIYMSHYTWISGDTNLWHRPLIYEYFTFGLASYQLYFLVILIWFYALMPLWRLLTRWLLAAPLPGLTLLLLAQIAFNYYSSYLLHAATDNYYLGLAIKYRMSYWVWHYLFIFLLGAVCAERYDRLLAFITQYSRQITLACSTALTGILTHYYYLVYYQHYTLEAAVNTVHQLSPWGVLYTVCATLFLFKVFSRTLPACLAAALCRLGKDSYVIYLVHPLVMYYLLFELNQFNLALTPLRTIAFYLTTLFISSCLTWLIQQTGSYIPVLGLLLTGSLPSKNKQRQPA